MTPKQIIRSAKKVTVMFRVLEAPDTIYIDISKTEAMNLIDEHNLPADNAMHPVGDVSEHEGIAFISFHT